MVILKGSLVPLHSHHKERTWSCSVPSEILENISFSFILFERFLSNKSAVLTSHFHRCSLSFSLFKLSSTRPQTHQEFQQEEIALCPPCYSHVSPLSRVNLEWPLWRKKPPFDTQSFRLKLNIYLFIIVQGIWKAVTSVSSKSVN